MIKFKSKIIEFKHNGNDFSAYYDAREWCNKNGYSSGSMCGSEPIGIKKQENYYIPKWRNLTAIQAELLDGTMQSNDFRNQNVRIFLKEDNNEKA